ncbi:aminotransferase class I/II-fold pyridoxal phosphate-dependent enzyme [Fictibacillus phosphorivorans]|uniref:aminotransferase class I/II-fold pyridoxal phosphate-dependent enzyme n=1 Tax=Fictibacillus phosphorivorans TaxID=1221500 RepID=UPI00203B8DA1|nr:aminotransferase class I/II-fold pyridoxal phosphate-dependent enzyme [Fictibacillus phosphorivorans]MCM3719903.1 aminotransferase class I/II-fold pyridoxal phosphate-dependent enzyme [Fictibacillus phosphorivorans]MCM3777593.1 aminotransferase class I/II-fold pyridoxal phosphate-dependent enzyme [Fictibacillus phosphorivorans]
MKHAPLYEALKKHTKNTKWSFHVPGHKNGHVFEEAAKSIFQSVLPLDATELTGLDDLHHPEGAILEAQELLSSFYNVKKSYFLVGGSTSGNLAMILSSFVQDDIVLVQRNCHKSVLNGLELAGVKPVFLSPEMDEDGGFPLGVKLETVKEAIKRYPECRGILLTDPTYYGMQHCIEDIAEEIHAHNGIVLVDEAHGAHFGLKHMPQTAIHRGADIVVQSAHKTLPALTMGAFLHVNSDRVDTYRLSQALQMVQSSSPSYLIMASLDLSRLYMENLSQSDMDDMLDEAEKFRGFIDSLKHLRTVKNQSGYRLDPLKIIVQSDKDISGFELQQLFEQDGLFTELADDRNVLFILPLGPIQEIVGVKDVFNKISEKLSSYKNRSEQRKTVSLFPQVSTLHLSYQDMKKMKVVPVSIEDAEGDTAAEAIIPYPPGIPLIAKGEKITSASIRYYLYLKEKGARFQGISEQNRMHVFDKSKEQ